MTTKIPVSPLALNQLTYPYWGNYDSRVLEQLAPLRGVGRGKCYTQKFYKAPSDDQELMAAFAYVTYGMQITPGSILYGVYLPMKFATANPLTLVPQSCTVQITDVSLEHKFWDDPISSLFLANYKPTFQGEDHTLIGTFPNLLTTPHPVVGSGLFDVEIQNTLQTVNPDTGAVTGLQQRVQLVFGVLEVCIE